MTVYAPTFLFAVGQGAVIPILALAARDVGASIPAAAVIVAMRGIGAMASDIPAGMIIGRLGERRAMSMGTGVLILSLLGAVWSPNPIAFGVFIFLMGSGWSVWLLARLAYVTDVVPLHLRGRALSTMGGMNRIGNFIGPFLGAILIAVIGIVGTFYLHMVFAVAGWLVLLLVPDPHSVPHMPKRFRCVSGPYCRNMQACSPPPVQRHSRSACCDRRVRQHSRYGANTSAWMPLWWQ